MLVTQNVDVTMTIQKALSSLIGVLRRLYERTSNIYRHLLLQIKVNIGSDTYTSKDCMFCLFSENYK